MEPSDRRRVPRYLLPGGVRPTEDPHAPPVHVLDFSLGGLRFESIRPMEAGTRLSFWFDYFDSVFRVHCEVAWSRPAEGGAWEHGARFVDLTPSEQQVVGAYVAALEAALDDS